MIRIAYIELDTHAEIARNFIELLDSSKKIQVDYYFSEKILKVLDLEHLSSVFKISPHGLFQLLKGKKYDLIIIGTAHRYFNIFMKIVECFPTAIISHNLNFIKATNSEILPEIFKKNTQFRLKLLLREGLLDKNKVYERAKYLWVLDENLSAENPKMKFMPLFFCRSIKQNKDEVFRVVIPGEVSQKRRNYLKVVQEIKELKTQREVEIIFLGKVKNQELVWLKDLEKCINDNIRLIYFTEKIPQIEFDRWLKKADVLWCPIQHKTEFFGIKEIYGKTKMSGNIGDAIKFAKPALFPETYQSQYFFVDNENQSIDNWIDNQPKIPEKYWEIFRKEQILLDLENFIFNFVKT